MNNHNFFVKFLRKINLLINSLLKKYLNKLNFKNLYEITTSNKVLLIFVTVVILFFSYLSIPHVYDNREIKKELKSQLLTKFNLDFNFPKNLNYHFFPTPHFTVKESYIFENQLQLANVTDLKISVSLKNLFSLEDILIKDVIIKNSNFTLNKKNLNFFIKILDNNFLEKSFTIKDSNIFFYDNEKEVLFINKIKKMNYYYDLKEKKNIVVSENEIFNIPYHFELLQEKKNKIISKINLDFLKLQIVNKFDYSNNKKKGLINIIYDKKKSYVHYNLSENFFIFDYFDKKNKPSFFYKGKFNLNPFFSNLEGNIDKLDLSSFFDSNLFFVQLFKTEILNNKNLNVSFSVNAKRLKQYQSFINVFLNTKIHEGLIDIDKTKFSWNNYVDFEFSDTLLYVNENNLSLDGKLLVNIKNYNEIYKSLQISKNLRPFLKNLELNFNYNFDQQIINLNSIKINGQNNKKVNSVLKKITLKKNNLQNKIYFKNILKKAIAVYDG